LSDVKDYLFGEESYAGAFHNRLILGWFIR